MAALGFIDSRWNTGPSARWYGNLNHPYAMWAVYKGLQVYGYLTSFDCGPGDILIGYGMSAAPGGFTICFDASPATSVAGDWYSHYCDYLVGIQNGDGSWSGYEDWYGAMATGWYINILNAVQIGAEEVALDIKPTSCPNPLNVKPFEKMPKNAKSMKGGILPVAILGTDDFDVYDIDVSTILLEGVAPLRHDYEDVAAPVEDGDECECTTAGPDGYMDLTLKFEKAEIVAALGAVGPGDVTPLTITGFLNDGREFEGVDCVRIIGEVIIIRSSNGGVVLGPAVPNPFNPMTRISFSLPEQAFVSLSVYDVAGRLVERLVSGERPAGEHFVEWDAHRVVSGIYFYRLEVGDIAQTRKMILVK